jgi:hypothetical protein
MAAEEARTAVGAGAFLQVRHEDLVAAPEQELRRICSFLGEEFALAMLTFYADADDQRELRIFEALAGSALKRYSYETALASCPSLAGNRSPAATSSIRQNGSFQPSGIHSCTSWWWRS